MNFHPVPRKVQVEKPWLRLTVIIMVECQGGNSQNILCKFIRFFLTLVLKILRLFWFKVVFEADINKG